MENEKVTPWKAIEIGNVAVSVFCLEDCFLLDFLQLQPKADRGANKLYLCLSCAKPPLWCILLHKICYLGAGTALAEVKEMLKKHQYSSCFANFTALMF